MVFNEEANVYEIHAEEPELEPEAVVPDTIDDTEKAPEAVVEVKVNAESSFPDNLPY